MVLIEYGHFDEEVDLFDVDENEISSMRWKPEYENITDNDIQDMKELLEEAYGKFDRVTEFDLDIFKRFRSLK